MTLTPGTRLGPYEIVSALGAGGMGEVYRATDTHLKRSVAIKVLPEMFAGDADRLARFAREAQVLASLNHPNIAAIYGIEQNALVMELVEGEDLSDLIHGQRHSAPAAVAPSESSSRGATASGGGAPRAISIEDSLSIARQLADALEAAHEAGIIHRDLKPANIKIRADGTVKVLDFGLAKALDPAGASGGDAANSPTLTGRATQMGMILGTAAYMAPEQAKGKAVDRRADIWAFGVVLYEMLTGRRAFVGDDISEVLASVLKTDPDWSALPAGLPPSIRRLLRRCLEKDPRVRLGAIGDARLELNEIDPVVAPIASPPMTARPSRVARLWPAATGIVVTAIAAALLWPSSRPLAFAGVTRASVLAPPGVSIYPDTSQVAISPDGSMVAFIVGDVLQTQAELWVRSVDSLSSRRLEGTDGANLPFWSPDSRRIGFSSLGKLKTVAVTGGRVETLSDVPGTFGRGASWSPSDVIVFARNVSGPLYRVSANGGDTTPATTLDAVRKQSGHRLPVFLPDGDHFLYAALPGRGGKFDIFVGSLRDGTTTLVGSMESAPVYAEPGWLLYVRQGVLAAQPFDARTLKVTGEAIPLDDEPTSVLDPGFSVTAGHATSISSSGSLAYFSSPAVNTTATWIDAAGKTTGAIALPAGAYSALRISPDGTHVVLVRPVSATEQALWMADLVHGGAAPFSSGRGLNSRPAWSPDGSRVVFASDRDGPQNFFIKNVADASPEQPLYGSPVLFKNPTSWSRDGRWIVFDQSDPDDTTINLYLLPASGAATPVPYARGPQQELGGVPSPDSRWLAYQSDETGRFELYVQSFPEPGHKQQVSTDGVANQWWTRDGHHLVFTNGDGKVLWRTDVESGPTLKASAPSRLGTLPPNVVAIDAMPDGQRFLALIPERAGTGSITLVQNWRAALEKKR